ncbi:MAG TPA: DUF535 family protein [Acidobacteriaceae bacterium]
MGEIQGRPFQFAVNACPEVNLQDSGIAPSGGPVAQRKRGKRLGFFRPLLTIARQGIVWSPLKIAGESWRGLISMSIWREILDLLKLEPFDEIIESNPALAFKYVVSNYIARGLTLAERASCFLHHYNCIRVALPTEILRQILQGDVEFHRISKGDNWFALVIGLPKPHIDREGELCLSLVVNDQKVFNLCFTIVPGSVVKSEFTEALLITHLQGVKGCNTQIQLARKAFRDYSPRVLLLAALQGVADALGILRIEAVCATKQRSYTKECSYTLIRGYDDFFTKAGMVKTAAGFYSSPVPIEGKPLASYRGRNRTRARKRRAMRKQIQSACTALLSGPADRVALASSVDVNSIPIPGAVGHSQTPLLAPDRVAI